MVNQNKIFSFKIKRQAKNVFPRDVKRTVRGRRTLFYVQMPLVLAFGSVLVFVSVSQSYFLVCMKSGEPWVGILPNIHGYMIGHNKLLIRFWGP